MNYSPKLKKAMQEVRQVLEEHDIAGSVVLHTPGFSEYLIHISPSYSCAKIERNGVLRVKASHLNIPFEEKIEMIISTANMFKLIGETSSHIANQTLSMSRAIDREMNCYHSDSIHTSKPSIDN